MATVEEQPRVFVIPSQLRDGLRRASLKSGRSIGDLMREEISYAVADPSRIGQYPADPGTGGKTRVRMGFKMQPGAWNDLVRISGPAGLLPTHVVRGMMYSIHRTWNSGAIVE